MTENDKSKPEPTVLPVCGMQCNVQVTQSLDHVRDEINNGNITGALLELHVVKPLLTSPKIKSAIEIIYFLDQNMSFIWV